MKIQYSNIFLNFTLTQFSVLIYTLKTCYNNYTENTTIEYYKILEIGHLYDKFVKKFLKKLEQSII